MCVISKGGIAGERIVRNDEVVGSIPTSSTISSMTCEHPWGDKANLSNTPRTGLGEIKARLIDVRLPATASGCGVTIMLAVLLVAWFAIRQ
jgi:hypothetical protein